MVRCCWSTHLSSYFYLAWAIRDAGGILRSWGSLKRQRYFASGGRSFQWGAKRAQRDAWLRGAGRFGDRLPRRRRYTRVCRFAYASGIHVAAARRFREANGRRELRGNYRGGRRNSLQHHGVREGKKKLSKICFRAEPDGSAGNDHRRGKVGLRASVAAEIKSLEAIREAAKQWPGTVVATLLGAHVVPAEFRNDATNTCVWSAKR